MPLRQEPPERSRIDRLHLATQPRQRATAQETQDIGVAPLAFRTAGPELAAQDAARRQQAFERVLDDPDRQPPAASGFGRQERPVRPGPARQQPFERAADRAEEGFRDPDGRGHPDPSR